MAKHSPTPDDIARVEYELWNVIRALDLIQRAVEEIAISTPGETIGTALGWGE